MSVVVTKHGAQRVRERMGLPKKAVQKQADRAAETGMSITETSGQLRGYLDSLHMLHRQGSDYRVTPDGVFVITNNCLVTMFPVPRRLRKTVLAHWENHKESY